MDEHEWVEITAWDDLPDRVWICNAHPGETRREATDAAWLARKLAADRRFYESLGLKVIAQGLR
jgi:hypothetical protein